MEAKNTVLRRCGERMHEKHFSDEHKSVE